MIETLHFRKLDLNDRKKLEQMQTGIEDDYVVRIFDRLIEHKAHEVYGLFADDLLASVGGYTIFADQYAMLGRLRTDERFRGEGFATKLLAQVIKEIKQLDGITWVSGNTQRHNYSGMKVLGKLDLPQQIALHPATLVSPEKMDSESGRLWTEITTIEEKRKWLQPIAEDSSIIFPYECYYPFPATWSLFKEEDIKDWLMFKNPDENRFIIIKEDQKKYKFAQTIYMWDDIWEQTGLWKTIFHAWKRLEGESDDEMFVRLDLTDQLKEEMPQEDAFSFQDPWVLHGKWL